MSLFVLCGVSFDDKTDLRYKVSAKTAIITPTTTLATMTIMLMSYTIKEQSYEHEDFFVLTVIQSKHETNIAAKTDKQQVTFLFCWLVWTKLAEEATGRSVGRRQSVLRTPVHAHIAKLRHLLHVRHNIIIFFYFCHHPKPNPAWLCQFNIRLL